MNKFITELIILNKKIDKINAAKKYKQDNMLWQGILNFRFNKQDNNIQTNKPLKIPKNIKIIQYTRNPFQVNLHKQSSTSNNKQLIIRW